MNKKLDSKDSITAIGQVVRVLEGMPEAANNSELVACISSLKETQNNIECKEEHCRQLLTVALKLLTPVDDDEN